MGTPPRRSGRLVLAAVAVGIAGYALAKLAPSSLEILIVEPGAVEALDLFGAACCAGGVLVPAWTFRRFLASAPLGATIPAAALGLFFFGLCSNLAFVALSSSVGIEIEELQGETGLARLGWIGLLTLVGTVRFFAAVLQTFYVSLPLAWLGLLALRRASAGLATPPRPAPLRAS